MLAYRHQFHAGNFADVFKHALLVQLVLALEKKEQPFFYMDTHAGIASYDLRHEWTEKNAEYKDGIARIWERADTPAGMVPYLAAVRAANREGGLRYYPGSPQIVRGLIRRQDRMLFTELNRKDYESLATFYARDRQVTVEHADGYQALNAHLPPRERRGLVLIDSSFDRSGEFRRLTDALKLAHRKFATGIYALWYPFMGRDVIASFERGIVAAGIRRILQVEIHALPELRAGHLSGCGMLVVNPPYRFEHAARSIVEWLHPALARAADAPSPRVRWLAGE